MVPTAAASLSDDARQLLIDTVPSMLTISEAIYGSSPEGRPAEVIDFRVISANQAALALFNRTPEQVVGRLVSEVFPYDRDNGVYDAYVRTVETGHSQQMDVPLHTPQGLRWFDIRTTLLSPGRITVLALDVTPLKEAQLLNQHQADTLWQVMNATPAAIVQHEAIRNSQGMIIDFKLTMVNQLAANWLGATPDSLQDTRLGDLFPGLQHYSLFRRYCGVVKTGEPTRFARHIYGVWYDFSVVKAGDGCLVVAIDVTQTYQQQQELETANAELTRSNDNLAQFAYVASHDLQEPLRKIQSFGDVLTSQFGHQFSPDSLDLLLRMQAASSRMSLLIRDLLDYSRISTHRESFKAVDLMALVQEAIDDLYLPIEENRATVESDPLPTVQGDRRQLKQLLQNLLSNALKFQRPNHPPLIQIRVTQLERSSLPSEVTVVSKATHFHVLSVIDNGIGFDDKYADRIFQVFQRLHGRARYPGTGVGLAICRKVAENHGGTITVASQIDRGSAFQVYLPL